MAQAYEYKVVRSTETEGTFVTQVAQSDEQGWEVIGYSAFFAGDVFYSALMRRRLA